MTRSYCHSDKKVQSCRRIASDRPVDVHSTFNLAEFDEKKKASRKANQKSYRASMRNVFGSTGTFDKVEALVSEGSDKYLSKQVSSSIYRQRKNDDDENDQLILNQQLAKKQPLFTHNIVLKEELKQQMDEELAELKELLKKKHEDEKVDSYLDKRSARKVKKLKKQMARQDGQLHECDDESTDSEVEEQYRKLKTSYLQQYDREELQAIKEWDRYLENSSPKVFKHYRKTKLK